MGVDNNRMMLRFIKSLKKILRSQTLDRRQKMLIETSTLYLSKDDENIHWRLEDGTEIVQECNRELQLIINSIRKQAFSTTSEEALSALVGDTNLDEATSEAQLVKSVSELEVKEAYIDNEEGRLHLSFVNPNFEDIDE